MPPHARAFSLMLASGLASASALSARTDGLCSVTDGAIIGTGSLASAPAADAGACCDACYAMEEELDGGGNPSGGCTAWTFAEDTGICYLKDNALGAPVEHSQRTSGVPMRVVNTRACFRAGHTDYPFCDASLDTEARIDDLISRIATADKPGMLTARQSPLGRLEDLGVPEYDWGSNCVHGVQSRCGTRCPTSFPNPVSQGQSWNTSLWYDIGSVVGLELRSLWLQQVGENHANNLPHLGLDCWSPNININRDPRWGRNQEVVSEDPLLSGFFGSLYTRGLQEGEDDRYLQSISTLKHWDAYSLEYWVETDGTVATRHNFDAKISNHDLQSTYWPAFRRSVVEGNAKGVMCSYNALNGVPTCANEFLEHVMRDVWGFTGYITSDSGAIEDIYAQHKYKNMTAAEGVAAAIKAGTDVDSSLDNGSDATGSPYTWYIQDALDQGLLEESDVDAALRNTLRMRFELGLFDPIEDQPYWHVPPEAVNTEESQALNLLSTLQAMTLVQNPDGVLPFAKDKSLAVIGPHSEAKKELVGNYLGQICEEGTGGDYSCIVSPAEALSELSEDSVSSVEGCTVNDDSATDIDAAVAAAEDASQVLLMVGLAQSEEYEGTGGDRTSLELPGDQAAPIQAVLDVGKPTAIVVLSGGCVALEQFAENQANMPAIMTAGYPGFKGGTAIAKTVMGDYNPGGKLAQTWYKAGMVNELDMTSMDMSAAPGRGYRYYQNEPVWAFGHGLSYTTFDLDVQEPKGSVAQKGDKATFSVDVKNTGAVDGDEVVQLYFTPAPGVEAANPGPAFLKQLAAFQRVAVKAGSTETVVFELDYAAVQLVDADGNVVSVPGDYDLLFTNGAAQSVRGVLTVDADAEVVVEAFPTLP